MEKTKFNACLNTGLGFIYALVGLVYPFFVLPTFQKSFWWCGVCVFWAIGNVSWGLIVYAWNLEILTKVRKWEEEYG